MMPILYWLSVGLQIDRVQQHARRAVLASHDLVDLDLAQLGLRPHPEDVGVIAVLDLPAVQAAVAAVDGHAVALDRVQAIERLGQRARQRLQRVELVAGEEVGMGQPPAFERALQQLHALRLCRKVFECHRALL